LTKEGSPYILEVYTVPAGKTLRLEPGTMIKGLNKTSRFMIDGIFSAEGTADEKIIFTSIRDRSFGDDRLNAASLGEEGDPESEDWVGLWLENGASGTLKYADFRYSGFDPYLCVATVAVCGYFSRTVALDASSLVVENSTFIAGGIVVFNSENSSSLSLSDTTLDGSPNLIIPEDPIFGIYAVGGSLNLRNVIFKNFYYGIRSDAREWNWPAVTAEGITAENFINVTYPVKPAALLPL